MIFKVGRFYKHESGSVAMVVGKIRGIALKKAVCLELNAPGQRVMYQPAGVEEMHTKGWVNITREDFVKGADDINKDVIEGHKTAIKEDNCMRKVVKTSQEDSCLAILLECGHVIEFDKADIVPKKDSQMHCGECVKQNKMIAERLGL